MAVIDDLVVQLLGEMAIQLERCAKPVCQLMFQPGDTTDWAYCDCEGDDCSGFAYVRLVTSYPSDEFPLQSDGVLCSYPITHQLEVGVVRCIAVEDEGELPTKDELTLIALEQMEDQAALRYAINNAAPRMNSLDNWVPEGPQGGCIGGHWTLYVSE